MCIDKKTSKFIIYSPAYDENAGGSIALHRLCDLINKTGRSAYLYPLSWFHASTNPLLKARSLTYDIYRHLIKSKFRVFSGFQTPIATQEDITDAVVIYPEIIFGNPLKGKKVVRWLLHKPGFHTGRIGYGESDILFYFQEAFNTHELNQNSGGKLQVLHVRNDIYRKFNFGVRTGTCYMERKGKGRPISHDLKNSILLDGLSHEEIASVFNRTEKFICYDPYTMYSQYAAVCGCLSIVVPREGQSREQWQPNIGLRLGVAYGFDDVEWAKQTQNDVLGYLKMQENTDNKSVANFIGACDLYFDK